MHDQLCLVAVKLYIILRLLFLYYKYRVIVYLVFRHYLTIFM